MLYTINNFDHVGTGLSLDVENDRRRLIHPGGKLYVLSVFNHVRNVGQVDWRATLVGNDNRPIFDRRLQLIIGVNGVSACGAIETAFGLIDVGSTNGSAHVIQTDTGRGERLRIHLYSYCGALPARQRDQSNARQLRNFLRDARVH